MKNPSSVKKPVLNAKKPVLTFQQRVEKWFLPVVFVAIGAVMVWTVWKAAH
jgi:hypothetical protein